MSSIFASITLMVMHIYASEHKVHAPMHIEVISQSQHVSYVRLVR